MAAFLGFCDDDGVFAFDYPAAYRKFLQKHKGHELEVEIRRRRTKRTLDQNAALHGMLAPWCDEGHLMDDLKRDVLEAVFGTREVLNAVTGQMVIVLNKPHTSQLNTAEFAFLMERTVEIAAECGVLLELPNEYKERKRKEARDAEKKAKAA